MAKYIFVTGGVVSSLGKGITAASLGRLLKNRGYKVTIQKFDPYINIDPGTMSLISMVKFSSPTTVQKRTSTSATMNASSTSTSGRTPTLRPVKFTGRSFRKNVAAIIWATRYRLFRTLRMKSRIASIASVTTTMPISSLRKSAVPSATLKACLSWKLSARSRKKSAATTSCTFTSPSFRISELPVN